MVTAAPASCSTIVQPAARREAAALYCIRGVEPGDLQPRPAGHRSWPDRGSRPYQPDDAWGVREVTDQSTSPPSAPGQEEPPPANLTRHSRAVCAVPFAWSRTVRVAVAVTRSPVK